MCGVISVRQWQEKYRAGAYASKNIDVQRSAGWWNWSCRSDALAGRLKQIAPVVMGVTDPFILDNYFLWFMNKAGRDKLVYDSAWFRALDGESGDIEDFKVDLRNPNEVDRWTLYTDRFSFYAPEFSCAHVRGMTKYIDNMARELEQGLRPPFLDEQAAAVKYILGWDEVRPVRAMRREGEHSYSFLDRGDGRRKTVHVAASLEDAPPGFQVKGSVQLKGFYVSCAENPEKTVAVPQKKKTIPRKKKTGVER